MYTKLINKYIIILAAIVLAILSFLKNWYSDQLSNFLWIGLLGLGVLLKAFYIIILILAIKTFRKEKSSTTVIALIILFITLITYVFFPFRDMKIQYELDKYEDKRMEIVNKVINKEFINIDEYGNMELPTKYKKYSTSGEITIYKNDSTGSVIGFWVFRGMVSGSTEIIYSTGEEKLIRENVTEHPVISIEKMKDKWYLVITDY